MRTKVPSLFCTFPIFSPSQHFPHQLFISILHCSHLFLCSQFPHILCPMQAIFPAYTKVSITEKLNWKWSPLKLSYHALVQISLFLCIKLWPFITFCDMCNFLFPMQLPLSMKNAASIFLMNLSVTRNLILDVSIALIHSIWGQSRMNRLVFIDSALLSLLPRNRPFHEPDHHSFRGQHLCVG